jgi:DnaJ-class molecular chaperone
VPDLRGFGVGDQIVEVTVVTPTKLTEQQKALLEEFAAIEHEKKEGGIFRRLLKRAESLGKARHEEAS